MIGPLGNLGYSSLYIILENESPPMGFKRTGHKRLKHELVKPEYHIYFLEHHNTFLMRVGLRILDGFQIIERMKIYDRTDSE